MKRTAFLAMAVMLALIMSGVASEPASAANAHATQAASCWPTWMQGHGRTIKGITECSAPTSTGTTQLVETCITVDTAVTACTTKSKSNAYGISETEKIFCTPGDHTYDTMTVSWVSGKPSWLFGPTLTKECR